MLTGKQQKELHKPVKRVRNLFLYAYGKINILVSLHLVLKVIAEISALELLRG